MVDRIDSRTRKRPQLWPVALLRIYTGVFFAWHGFGKLRGGNFVDGMSGFLESRLESSYGFYRPFLEFAVLPNKELFAFLVSWGELSIGLALIVGLATRYASFAGAFLVTNFWWAKGESFLAGSNHDAIWLVVFLVLALVPAGRVAGLDDGLSDRMRFLR
ncbi:MAG: DoxX family protein [Gammaproteobacteria bacterium]|nr:DoxX family protein [Gammaproteobacteria bacterium]MDH4315284.1 DoxX family protein [Gammaproteobacteria bacterium]MDH5213950.1 DoxX family protein [Gammaproteobacteria bacterium]MDH5499584.1 DoxX family protein [Gammaproteobacteria bacterium]